MHSCGLSGNGSDRQEISSDACEQRGQSGGFDVRKGAFHIEAMKEMEIEPSILPEITEEHAELGRYRGIPVTAALGDNQASFLGSVGIHKNILLLNMGTGGQISALSDQYFEAPGIEARPFVKGKYLLAGTSLCGGRAYAVLEHFFRNLYKSGGHGRNLPTCCDDRTGGERNERHGPSESLHCF